MARPCKQIDPKQIEKLASILCTTSEIAAVLGCSQDTLERRFSAVLDRGREQGRASLRRQQYKLAMGGNATMCIWLGKQWLGQKDKHDVENSGDVVVKVEWDDADGSSQVPATTPGTTPNPD